MLGWFSSNLSGIDSPAWFLGVAGNVNASRIIDFSAPPSALDPLSDHHSPWAHFLKSYGTFWNYSTKDAIVWELSIVFKRLSSMYFSVTVSGITNFDAPLRCHRRWCSWNCRSLAWTFWRTLIAALGMGCQI